MARFHKAIATIWIIFTVIFSGMAIFHFNMANDAAPDLTVNFPTGATVVISGMDMYDPVRQFASQFNDYVHSQNASSHTENLAAMWGYILAALVSLVSLSLEIGAIRENNGEKSKNSDTDES